MPDLANTMLRNLLARHSYDIGILKRYAASGKFINYVPTFTSTGTAVNLGPDGVQSGRYVRIGNVVYARGTILFGTSGVAAGTGNYQIGLPAAATTNNDTVSQLFMGNWRSTSGASQNNAQDIVIGIGASVMTARYPATWPFGGDQAIGAAVPWAWAINNRIQFQVIYEANE